MVKGISLIIAALVCAPAAMAQQDQQPKQPPKPLPAPSMASTWRGITLDQASCLTRAQTAMRAAGLTTNFEAVGESVFGELLSYTAEIRCVAAKGLVWFVVAGPDVKQASQHQRNMAQSFEKGGQ